MRAQRQTFDTRQGMQRQQFEIFHYYDPKLQDVALHHHDFYEIYFFLSDAVEYRVEGTTYRLQSGDILLISPFELHQPLAAPDAPYERIVLWINKSYLQSLCRTDCDLGRCFDLHSPTHQNMIRPVTAEITKLSSLLQALMDEAYGTRFGNAVYSEGLLQQLLVELNRMAGAYAGIESDDRPQPLVEQVLTYINLHYSEALTLETLSEQFYVSKYYLSHVFRQSVGTSLYRYIILKRLLMARQLLSDGEAPGEVARTCGFGDYANFYRAFSSEYGCSPKTYLQSIQT